MNSSEKVRNAAGSIVNQIQQGDPQLTYFFDQAGVLIGTLPAQARAGEPLAREAEVVYQAEGQANVTAEGVADALEAAAALIEAGLSSVYAGFLAAEWYSNDNAGRPRTTAAAWWHRAQDPEGLAFRSSVLEIDEKSGENS